MQAGWLNVAEKAKMDITTWLSTLFLNPKLIVQVYLGLQIQYSEEFVNWSSTFGKDFNLFPLMS